MSDHRNGRDTTNGVHVCLKITESDLRHCAVVVDYNAVCVDQCCCGQQLCHRQRCFNSVCVLLITPVTLGNVARIVALIRRMWSSACASPSVAAGLVFTKLLMYVPVSSAMIVFLGFRG